MLPLLLLLLLFLICSPPRIRINPNVPIASHYQRVLRRCSCQRLRRVLRHVGIAEFGPEPQCGVRVKTSEVQKSSEHRLIPPVVPSAGSVGIQTVDVQAAF